MLNNLFYYKLFYITSVIIQGYYFSTFNNYLQLLYREVKGISLCQGFPRPILSTKHHVRSKGCFVDKIDRGNPWLSKFFNFPKK